MGCDGGTIPKRDELVRTKKKPEQKDKQSELSFKWGHCSITQEPLQTPIVACQLGRLYSKVAVIEALLDRTTLPDAYKHIKSIKDVKELNLTDNPAYKNAATKGDAYNDNVAAYICPVIGLEMNGKYRFVYFWSCGCVLSERALKAVKTKICHKCQKPFTEDDIVVLNGNEEDLELMKQKMAERQEKLKAEKKLKKSSKNGAESEQNVQDKPTTSGLKVNGNTTEHQVNGNTAEHQVNGNTAKHQVNGNTAKHQVNGNTAKHQVNGNTAKHQVNGITHKAGVKRPNGKLEIEDPDFKKTKINYSVAKDPKATEVFKSLFTTHKSAEKQNKAHWVTYNPFYN